MFDIINSEDLIKMLIAVLVGGIIGAEREYHDKAAGLRTNIFICLGATLFTLFSARLGGSGDPARIAANIVSGVGFLGAGAIFRDTGKVSGLTTAATIWLIAALGMGIGAGQLTMSLIGAGIVLMVLIIFPTVEFWIGNIRDMRTYEVVIENQPEILAAIEDEIKSSGLRIESRKRRRTGADLTCSWRLYGKPHQHELITEKLLKHPEIKEFNA